MQYDPRNEQSPLPFSPFKACTVPRPIGWLSTISPEGVHNLAPYSQWQNLTFDPPMVMFSANQAVSGERKDTVRNAEQTGWFNWNMAVWDLREAVNISAKAFTPDVDEFVEAGVEKLSSHNSAAALVAGTPCHFECRYVQTLRVPARSSVGTVDIVIGEVARIHVADEVITADGKMDVGKIRPIARMGYFDYAVIEKTFEMRIPDALDIERAGLEGRIG